MSGDFRLGSWLVQPSLNRIVHNGKTSRLEPKMVEVLVYLAERPGELVSKEQLMRAVWMDTFVTDDVLTRCISELRRALEDDAKEPHVIETIPRRGYRFIAPVSSDDHKKRTVNSVGRKITVVAALIVVAAILAGGLYWRSRQARRLTEMDTVVLADFVNSTGDAVWDDTLKTALNVSLRQSHFLNVLSDSQVRKTLQSMTRPAGTKLTPEVAREVCQRAGSKAYLSGSIGILGNEYVLSLNAVNCESGDTLAQEQMTAASKEKVLETLGKAASKVRGELGESLSTVQTHPTALNTTTSSLEAVQAYILAQEMQGNGDYTAAVPLFQRAIRLDPNFAYAYARLGATYWYLGESSLAAENAGKAYELRERVSERERIGIEARYYHFGSGNLEKARRVYQIWARTFPHNDVPSNNQSAMYWDLGQYDNSVAQARESIRLNSAESLHYHLLVRSYLYLNRLEEARATVEEAQEKKLEIAPFILYQIAFLKKDVAGMAQQVAGATGKPGVEDMLLANEADTAAYFGRLRKAREFSRSAVSSAQRAEEEETGAYYEAAAALREALFGNEAQALERAAKALALSTGRDAQYEAALALAFAGNSARAQALADDLGKRFPEGTVVQFNYLPTIHAQLALGRKHASKAVEALQAAAPYELGKAGGLYPVFVRGEAYLAGHQGSEAAAEFKKILDHRGVVLNEPIGALAHLQLGRAYAMADDTAEARAAYQDFLTLWKDADPDIPILIAANAEYAKLK